MGCWLVVRYFTLPLRCILQTGLAIDGVLIKVVCHGRGDSTVVSILAFYFDDPMSNPASYEISGLFHYEKTKIMEKRPGLAH